MAHEWDDSKSNTRERPFQRYRFCVKCGAEQTLESSTFWGRVVRYSWYPLVGRCKPLVRIKESGFFAHSVTLNTNDPVEARKLIAEFERLLAIGQSPNVSTVTRKDES